MIALAISLLATAIFSSTVVGSTYSSNFQVQCSSLKAPNVPGANVISVNGTVLRHHTVPATPPFLNTPVTGLNVCAVDIILKHPNADDQVLVKVWMPLDKWNGRFQATGGSGYAAGTLDLTIGPAAKQGYAAASTDAGVGFNPASPEAWALKKDGSVNQEALTNFAHRSVHDMAVVGKSITKQFYGRASRYSYWNGCSTGGRQGMAAAQRYPDLFDGILSAAPAINWARYVVAEQWPQVVMHEEQTFPSQCELKAFTDTAIAECDRFDGFSDGIIENPDTCHFNPYELVGRRIKCDDGVKKTITKPVARVVQKILQGMYGTDGEAIWSGMNVGAALDTLANTAIVDGRRVGQPFFVNDAWIRYFIAKNPKYDTASIDYTKLYDLFNQSQAEFGDIIGTENADLSGFEKHGGKLLMWHGLADQIIFPGGTIDYRQRVERLMGGPQEVDGFFRLFLAPGVDHCAGTPNLGAVPGDPLGALVRWVEDKKAPSYLDAESSSGHRIICPYPKVAHYVGGNRKEGRKATVERNFECR